MAINSNVTQVAYSGVSRVQWQLRSGGNTARGTQGYRTIRISWFSAGPNLDGADLLVSSGLQAGLVMSPSQSGGIDERVRIPHDGWRQHRCHNFRRSREKVDADHEQKSNGDRTHTGR